MPCAKFYTDLAAINSLILVLFLVEKFINSVFFRVYNLGSVFLYKAIDVSLSGLLQFGRWARLRKWLVPSWPRAHLHCLRIWPAPPPAIPRQTALWPAGAGSTHLLFLRAIYCYSTPPHPVKKQTAVPLCRPVKNHHRFWLQQNIPLQNILTVWVPSFVWVIGTFCHQLCLLNLPIMIILAASLRKTI